MSVRIINADVFAGLAQLEDESVQCVVTSPPYWSLRDYGVEGQIGLEPTPEAFVEKMVAVFREVKRVLRSDGTLWLNLGDSYATSMFSGNYRDGKFYQRKSPVKNQNWAGTDLESRKTELGSASGLMQMTNMKPKDLIGIPWLVAFALRADGWCLRQEIIWNKPNPMPESVQDRCTKSHEHIFLLSKSERYFYDAGAIREEGITGDMRRPYGSPGANALDPRGRQGNGEMRKPRARGHERSHDGFNGKWDAMSKAEQQSNGRNKRSVWTIATQPYAEAHFATFPQELPATCIKAGCPAGGTVLDPFGGAGTTGLVADQLGRNAILIELNPEYVAMAERRIQSSAPLFAQVETTVSEKQLDLEDSLSGT